MVRVGDKVQREPVSLSSYWEGNKKKQKVLTGRVAYVHPRGRYHMVEFTAKRGGVVRECFPGVET